MTERQRAVLEHVREHGPVSQGDLAEHFNTDVDDMGKTLAVLLWRDGTVQSLHQPGNGAKQMWTTGL